MPDAGPVDGVPAWDPGQHQSFPLDGHLDGDMLHGYSHQLEQRARELARLYTRSLATTAVGEECGPYVVEEGDVAVLLLAEVVLICMSHRE